MQKHIVVTVRCFPWPHIRSQSQLNICIVRIWRYFLGRTFLIFTYLLAKVIYCKIYIFHEVFDRLEWELLSGISLTAERVLAPSWAANLLLTISVAFVRQIIRRFLVLDQAVFVWMYLSDKSLVRTNRLSIPHLILVCIFCNRLLKLLTFEIAPSLDPNQVLLELLEIKVLNFNLVFGGICCRVKLPRDVRSAHLIF